MIRMFIPIFASGKAVVLESGFCVTKSITDLDEEGVYVTSMIKKMYYCPNGVPGDLIDNQFEYKEVSDVGML